MSRLLLPLYAAVTSLAAPALRLLLRRRLRAGKEIKARLLEREGIEATPRPQGKLIWLHAASVGETNSILPVLAQLRNSGATLLLTTGTVTSAELLDRRVAELGLGGQVLHRFIPLDVPAWVGRFLDHWRPDAGGLVESEIWPNLLLACRARGVKLMLVNARLSPRSFARWRRLPGLATTLFGGFARVEAQSAADAARLERLGACHVSAPGNLKFASPPLPVDRTELARLAGLLAGRPVWLAACTHPGEETIAIAVHRRLSADHPGLLTVILPRHPQRGAEVAQLAGLLPVTRRSLSQDPPTEAGLWVVDTLGELGLLYRAVRPVFLGRSLAVFGGHNPLEAARLGCAVAVGPWTGNFPEIVPELRAAGALVVVADAAALADFIDRMLRDPGACRAMGQAGIAAAGQAGELPRRIARALADLAGLTA